MSQNTSSAVMQQRSEPHDSLDDFPTQPWATRALMEHVIIPQSGLMARADLKSMTVWEPACNRGHMSTPLREYFSRVVDSDINQYGNHFVCDFLIPGTEPSSILLKGADWIITNPPFRLAEQFIERARRIKGWRGTAMIVRTSFLEGSGRYKHLFSVNPPTIVAQFSERVIMHKGVLRDPAEEYFDEKDGKWKKPSTATSYCWLVWMANADRRPMIWIPPCYQKLRRPDDYISRETTVPHRVPSASQGNVEIA